MASVAGESRRCGAAAWPAASSAAAHRRGPLPPRRYPAPAAQRSSPLRTLVTGLQEPRGVLLAPGIVSPRKDRCQGRTSSLRCGRSTLTAIFPGKIRHLPGGREG